MHLRYFTLDEFDSPDEPGSGSKMDRSFLELLDKARDRASVPFVITSGYRSPLENRRVGGVVQSAHMKGMAADIAATNPRTRFLILEALLHVGINRVGLGRTYIHADVDPSKDEDVAWNYTE